jgi:ornithine cyclodeaminase/alanine dehydrogenase
MPPLLYLAHDDVLRCALTPPDIADAVRAAFLAQAAGSALTAPSLQLRLPDRNFVAKGAVLADAGVAVMKWFGNVAHNDRRGLADYNPTLVVNDLATGLPVALMDGAWVTAVRTAAISVVAAGLLARPDAATLGIVGCGRQGAAHLDALRRHFPLRSITLHSRSRASAERLADVARSQGLAAQVTSDARAAVEGQDIVVSAITRHSERTGFLRGEWLEPGAFTSMVDMGFAFDAGSMAAIDFLVSDELDSATRRSRERLNFTGEFHTDLASLVANPSLAAARADRRNALIFAGAGLADAAAAAAVYRRARERGIGVELER